MRTAGCYEWQRAKLPLVTEPALAPRWRRRFETAAAVLTAGAGVQIFAAAIVAFGVDDVPDINRRLDLLVRQTGLLPGLLLLLAASLVLLPEVAGEPPSRVKGVTAVVSAIAVVGLMSIFIALTGVMLAFTSDGPAAVRIARPMVDLTAAAVSATAVWLVFRQGGR